VRDAANPKSPPKQRLAKKTKAKKKMPKKAKAKNALDAPGLQTAGAGARTWTASALQHAALVHYFQVLGPA
jgi:hypothetical protein